MAESILSSEQQELLQSFMERLDASDGLGAALRLVASECDTFFAFQACKVLQKLVKRFGTNFAGDRRTAKLVARCAATMPAADAVSISRALWAVGRLGLQDREILEMASARLPAVLPECGPITLATIWHAFEVLQWEHPECLDLMADLVIQRQEECDPPEVSIVLHAVAQVKFPKRDLLIGHLVPHVRQHEGSFSARHLAVCFHAAARAGVKDDKLCQIVTERFRTAFADVDALALTSAVYACGLLGFRDEKFLAVAAEFL